MAFTPECYLVRCLQCYTPSPLSCGGTAHLLIVASLYLIMANLNEGDILSEYGGVIESSFCTTFDPNLDPNDDMNPSTPLYPRSEFLHPDDVVTYLENNKHNFTIFNLNVDSINTKYNQLRIFMESLLSKNLSFSAITIQEAWSRSFRRVNSTFLAITRFPKHAFAAPRVG